MLYVFIIIIVLSILSIFLIIPNKKVWHNPEKEHLENVIENANFFHRFNKYDLIARKADSNEAYKMFYKMKLQNFNPIESDKLTKLITIINNKYLYKYPDLYKLRWNFVKSEGLENNYPHTLGDIIFLPASFFNNTESSQLETLIHEKIHVYQRYYPIETSKYIASLGFKIYDTQTSVKNIRTNPDTDNFIYIQNNTVQTQVYNSETPSSIADSSIQILKGDMSWKFDSPQQEHPFEIMACMLARLIIQGEKIPTISS